LRGRLLRLAGPRGSAAEAACEVDQVLDQVQAQGLLCERRFVEGFVRLRAARFGPARLRYELSRRGIEPDLIEAALGAHQGDEYARAQALWARRFKSGALNERERARQARFLSGRGFSHEVIRRILKTA
jgi:regulatory protein